MFEIKDGHHLQHRVALNMEQARYLRKQHPKAKKLHIYQDHTFTAVHMYGKQECVVCTDKISGLFGKQGYSCRGK